MKLWSGRFSKITNHDTDALNASILFDYKLLPYDIKASIAHVKGLGQINILTEQEQQKIINGLLKIETEYQNDKLEISINDEDVHMLIERLLIEDIGAIGKKVHTGRSRNDQVAVATRLYTIDNLSIISEHLEYFIKQLNILANTYKTDLMPGCTHLQAAQPITLGFWFDAYSRMFSRDLEKLQFFLQTMNECPLGSAALAGTSYPLPRHEIAKILDFTDVSTNSLDAVSNRDYIIDTLYTISLIAVHLSKMAEEIILFNSQVYNYITLDDAYATGSSIMPQKKNPDIAELTRGKSARLIANLMQILTLIKATPLAYNKDFQEDKESLFDSIENIIMILKVFPPMLISAKFNLPKMRKDCQYGYINATDLADYLVLKSIPFRDSHEIVGKLVKLAESKQIALDELSLDDFQQYSSLITKDVYEFIKIENCLKRRISYGGVGWYIQN